MKKVKSEKFIRLPQENIKEAQRLMRLLEKRLHKIQSDAELILIKALREKLGLNEK